MTRGTVIKEVENSHHVDLICLNSSLTHWESRWRPQKPSCKISIVLKLLESYSKLNVMSSKKKICEIGQRNVTKLIHRTIKDTKRELINAKTTCIKILNSVFACLCAWQSRGQPSDSPPARKWRHTINIVSHHPQLSGQACNWLADQPAWLRVAIYSGSHAVYPGRLTAPVP